MSSPYNTILQSKHLIAPKEKEGGLSDFTAERIFREFKRVEQAVTTLNTKLEAIKAKRSFFIPFHSSDPLNIINTNNKTEPTAFGTTGMFLERFANVNINCFNDGGEITGLKLYSAVTMASLGAGEVVNFKIAYKFEGAAITRFGPTHTIDGTITDSTVAQGFVDCIDISELISEFQSGDLFIGVGAWVTGGPAANRVLIGASATNPGPYTAIIVETEDD